MRSRGAALLVLGGCGAVLLVGLIMLSTLSFQLSQQAAFTDLYLQQYPDVQRALLPLLGFGAAVLPQIASPRAPADLGPWFAPLTAAWAMGCAVAALGYLGALWVLSSARVPVRAAIAVILGFEAVYILTVFAAPGLLSQDVFGYLMYGQVADVHGLNPYIWPPSAFAHDPLLQWVAPIWRTLPTPYGPVWTDVNWALSHLVREWSIVEQVSAYKLLSTSLMLAALALLWWLLGRTLTADPSGTRRLVAFTAFAWNPLVLFEIAGNGHNDVLALVLLLAGLVPLATLSRGVAASPTRLIISATFFVLSALVKFLSGIAMVFLLIGVLRDQPGWRRRGLLFAAIGGWALLVTVVLFAPWLELPDSLDSIVRQTGGNMYANAVPDLISLTVSDQILNAAGMPLGSARDTARLWMKALVDLGFLAYLAWEGRRLFQGTGVTAEAPVIGLVRASARASLVLIMIVSIWVQSWYFILPIGLAVLLGLDDVLARVTLGYTLTAFVALYVHYYLQDAASGAVYLAYAALPIIAALGVSWLRPFRSALRRWRGGARHALRLVDERGQALIPNTPRRATVAELDSGPTNERTLTGYDHASRSE